MLVANTAFIPAKGTNTGLSHQGVNLFQDDTQWDHHSALIHHSDRGLQYCCGDYISVLSNNGITISMTEKGDPYENAIAERVNGILKHEFQVNQTFRSLEEAEGAICRVIPIYNEQRPHSSCNYLTPEEAHKKEGLLTAKWKPKNEILPVQ